MGLFDLFGSSSSSSDDDSLSIEITEGSDPFTGKYEYASFRDASGKEVDRASVKEFRDPIAGGGVKYVERDGERYEIDKW